jgi:hypothetical protein
MLTVKLARCVLYDLVVALHIARASGPFCEKMRNKNEVLNYWRLMDSSIQRRRYGRLETGCDGLQPEKSGAQCCHGRDGWGQWQM